MDLSIIFLIIGLFLIFTSIILKIRKRDNIYIQILPLVIGIITTLLSFLPSLLDYAVLHSPKLTILMKIDSISQYGVIYSINIKNNGDLPVKKLKYFTRAKGLIGYQPGDKESIIEKEDEITFRNYGPLIPIDIKDSISFNLEFNIFYETNILWKTKSYTKTYKFNIPKYLLKSGEQFSPESPSLKEEEFSIDSIINNLSKYEGLESNNGSSIFGFDFLNSLPQNKMFIFDIIDVPLLHIYYKSSDKDIVIIKKFLNGENYILHGKIENNIVRNEILFQMGLKLSCT